MLSPEVWQFPPPSISVNVKTNLPLEKVKQTVEERKFYHSIFLICAVSENVPKDLNSLLTDTEYYKIADCSVSQLLESHFIEKIIKKGHLTCLSIDKCHSINIAICGKTLLIELDASTYQDLGIACSRKISKNYEQVYCIEKNLDTLVQENKNIECFKNKVFHLGKFTFLMTWEPFSCDVCPSSVAHYFNEQNLQVETCVPQLRIIKERIPFMPEVTPETVFEVLEWMGMIGVGEYMDVLSADGNPTGTPLPTITSGIHIIGFFPTKLINKLIDVISEAVPKENLEWICVSVQAMHGAPTGRKEKNSVFPSDDLITFFMNKFGNLTFKSFV